MRRDHNATSPPLLRAARAARAACVACAAGVVVAALSACVSSDARDASSGGGASPSPPGTSPEPDPGPDEASCAPGARSYLAFLAKGACTDVPGARGSWISHRLFPEAPEAVRDQACAYRWRVTAADPSAPPDVAALEGLAPEMLSPYCVKPSLVTQITAARGTAVVVPPPTEPSIGAPTGVSGCDVCARVARADVFVVLPADKRSLKRISVKTTAGRFVSFDLTSSDAASQAFSVSLPPLTDGTAYVEGRVPFVDGL